jgi:site-specific DNA-methyltransferase (cytosine-N4-specific)
MRLKLGIKDNSNNNLLQTDLRKVNYLNRLDWELEDANTRYFTHNYHPYSAKYIPQIPHYLITNLTKRNDLILDNFVGSGTTLVESKILGRHAIGVDINPLACLVAKVKTTNIHRLNLEKISAISRSIKEDILKLRASGGYNNNTLAFNLQNPESINNNDYLLINIPHPNILKWFDKNVIYELLTIKSKIDSLEDNHIKDFLLVAFSSILRSISNATSGFGNLMINKQPPKKSNIYEKFNQVVSLMAMNMEQFNQLTKKNNSTIRIFNHDTRNLKFIADETIDFICTHPPYMASVPYAEYQKLSLWWLGISQQELENKLIGGRRARRDTPERFFQDMFMTLIEMKRVLHKKKYCCIVIGNPVYNNKDWRLNEIIKKDASDIGFTLLKEITRRKYRLTMGKMKQEFILIFKN